MSLLFPFVHSLLLHADLEKIHEVKDAWRDGEDAKGDGEWVGVVYDVGEGEGFSYERWGKHEEAAGERRLLRRTLRPNLRLCLILPRHPPHRTNPHVRPQPRCGRCDTYRRGAQTPAGIFFFFLP